MTIDCAPPCGKRSSTPFVFTAPQPSSSHPQPDTPQLLHSSRLTGSPDVVPIRYFELPARSVDPVNCTHTESLAHELLSAFSRSQSLYVCVGSAMKASLTSLAGAGSGDVTFGAPRFVS